MAYKVLTKVLVLCLPPFLDDLIGPLQSSFIPGRGTADNSIIAQEVVHYMHHSKAKNGVIAFKIDLEKAYDRIHWVFLDLTLIEFGFPSTIVNLIMWCVRSSNLSILWNGARLESFKPTRGLRQGYPLFPYLFVLCMERLALNIQHMVDSGIWHPVRISKGGPGLSHLFFTDDVLLFCRANSEQVQIVSDTHTGFCQASGMKVNFDKSKAMCFSKVSRHRKELFSSISSINFVRDLGTYLGFPLVQGRVNKNIYNDVIEKIHRRMAAWKGRLLNKAGRICLAKLVTTSIPVQCKHTIFQSRCAIKLINFRAT